MSDKKAESDNRRYFRLLTAEALRRGLVAADAVKLASEVLDELRRYLRLHPDPKHRSLVITFARSVMQAHGAEAATPIAFRAVEAAKLFEKYLEENPRALTLKNKDKGEYKR